MTRRAFPWPALAAAAGAQAPPPNFVLVLSDDHSYPFLGCYGDPVLRTPNLDRFARSGLRCERAFTTAPQCVPSRTSLLTGRSPIAARMGRFNAPLPPEIPTLPELLRVRNYFTGVCRRVFHLDGTPSGPLTGELYRGLRTFDRRVDYLDRSSPRAETKKHLDEFFDRRPKDRPFFLWVNFDDPHYPWDRGALDPPHDPAKVRVPAHLPDLPGIRQGLARHCDEIGRMDEEFQWVLDALDQRGLAENTVVVFMGDNGMAFPRGKGSLHETGLNVPLLIRWPGVIPPGTVTRELISGEDLTPTLLAAAGLTAPKECTGRSFLPLLRGEPFTGRDYLFGERGHHGANSIYDEQTTSNGWDLSRCVRSRRYKLIYNCTPHMRYEPVNSMREPYWLEMVAAHRKGTLAERFERIYFGPRPILELYDLDRDPAEFVNLAGRPEMAEIEKELKIELVRRMTATWDFLPFPIRI
jgi:arylsulfatase A-like enzyme